FLKPIKPRHARFPTFAEKVQVFLRGKNRLTVEIVHLALLEWFRQFVVLVVCIIGIGVLHLLLGLPVYILAEANWQARTGVIGGDPLGMPSYITALTFGTCMIVTFLQLYVWLPMLFILYYLYGSIESFVLRVNNER
ncbi:MAG: hypothetical protein II429_10275, partial [Prevotella sp.]|nr:hypothetical protein [Prevotella sp.]